MQDQRGLFGPGGLRQDLRRGTLQECGQDTDCKAGFVCRSLKCVPRAECERSDDCPAGKACESGRCTTVAPPPVSAPECTNDLVRVRQGLPGRQVRHLRAVRLPGRRWKAAARLLRLRPGGDRAEAQGDLTKNAACIKEKGFTKKIVVEGNTDDRGTVDYNLQLGQRRAEAAKKFLVNLGVPAKSIKTVSYGKERPVCSEATETCWQKNRRGDTVAQ